MDAYWSRDMKDTARELRAIVESVEPQLARMDHAKMGIRPNPQEWSKKEILGHLIDSAANNHQRLVRAVNNAAAQFPTYNQTKWVKIQRHNDQHWPLLVTLWAAYNRHLSHLIACIPGDAASNPCNIGKNEPVTLEWLVLDYLRHLRLHLKDILGGGEST